MTHCKIRLSLGSMKRQNRSILHWSYNVFILFRTFQEVIPKKMNAKSLSGRQLAPICVFGAKTGNASIAHLLRINITSFGVIVA